MKHYQDSASLNQIYSCFSHIGTRGEFLKKYSKKSIRDLLLELIGDTNNKRVIDIGIGNGTFINKLHDRYPQGIYSGLDIIYNPLCENNWLDYRIYDGINFPEYKEKHDIILLMHMLYHVADFERFFKNIKNIACPKAKIYITTKSKNTLPHIEHLFLDIIRNFDEEFYCNSEKDESQFCSENANEIINRYLQKNSEAVKSFKLNTELFVTDKEELLHYILSTPRYGHEQFINNPKYLQLWRRRLIFDPIFVDKYCESIYAVEL